VFTGLKIHKNKGNATINTASAATRNGVTASVFFVFVFKLKNATVNTASVANRNGVSASVFFFFFFFKLRP